jgi:hypothetical protein
MNALPSAQQLQQARQQVISWMFEYDSDPTNAFCARIAEQFGLELRTSWDPQACLVEAHWQLNGRTAELLERRFFAITALDARLLACAELAVVLRGIYGICARKVERAEDIPARPEAGQMDATKPVCERTTVCG